MIKARQVHRHDQTLVGDNPPGQAANVEVGIALVGNLRLAPGYEESRSQIALGQALGVNEYLLDAGQRVQCDLAADTAIGGHGPPTDYL